MQIHLTRDTRPDVLDATLKLFFFRYLYFF